MSNQKSLCITYFLWLIGGWFGLHQLYLGRDRHAFVLWMSFGGYFGCGWIRDLFYIPRYVKDVNDDPEYLASLGNEMRRNKVPSSGFARNSAKVIIADILGYLVIGAIPTELLPESDLLFRLLCATLAPFAVAVGVHTIGNIGRHRGEFKVALIGAFLTAPLYMYSTSVVFWSSLVSSYCFNTYTKEWRRAKRLPSPFFKRAAILIFCAIIYLSLWASWGYFNCSIVDKDEQEVKCRDAAKNFLKSPMWQECRKVFDDLKLYIQVHGWSGLWKEIVDAFDPQGEVNALKVLGLSSSASQEEVTAVYRKLSRQWHPDKHKNPEEKLKAQERFIEIQQAYEILSRIKAQRMAKNKA